MASWYGLYLGEVARAFRPRLDIQEGFVFAYMAAGQPHDMAMFSSSYAEGGVEEVTVYFSPRAEKFARTIAGAVPCAAPRREDLCLDVGYPGCWELVFPRQGKAANGA